MRRLGVALMIGVVLFASAACAEAPGYALVKDKSTLKFSAIQNNAPVEGKFTDFTTDIRFDPDHPELSIIKADVNTASVVMADDDIVKYLKMPDWLSVEAFPRATFATKKISRMPASDNFYADGELALRGKTVPVTLNFQMEYPDDKTDVAKGYVTLHRKDFGIGQGEWAKDDVVKDEVRVEFRVVAQKQ